MKKPTSKSSSKKAKYRGSKGGSGQGSGSAAAAEVYMAERIDGKRKRAGKIQYLVKWKDWPASSNTWEPLEHLTECDELIEDYEMTAAAAAAKTKAKTKPSGQCEDPPPPSTATEICKSPHQSRQPSASQSSRPAAEPDHLPAKDRGTTTKWIPEEILGATDIEGELKFLIKFKGLNREYLVPSRTLRRLDPQMLIRYYEQHRKWMED